MICIIGAVKGLELKSDCPNHNLYSKLDPNFKYTNEIIRAVGEMQHNLFTIAPIYLILADGTLTKENQIDLSQLITNINTKLSLNLWYIKDSSINVSALYAFNIEDGNGLFVLSNPTITLSNGTNQNILFTNEEIDRAEHLAKSFGQLTNVQLADTIKENSYTRHRASVTEYIEFDILYRAFNFITLARRSTHILERMSWYVVALECFFGDPEPNDLSFKLSNRLPLYFCDNLEDKKELSKVIKKAYNLRSRFLHGVKGIKDKDENLPFTRISQILDDLLRKVFLDIIENEDKRQIFLSKNEPSQSLFKSYFEDLMLK